MAINKNFIVHLCINITKLPVFLLFFCSFLSVSYARNEIDITNNFDKQKEIVFSAEKTEYDYKTNSIIAYGNIVISQQNYIIKSDSLYYDKENKWVFLSGNVYILDNKTKQDVFLEEVYLIGSVANIIGTNIGAILENETTIKGEYFIKKDNNISVIKPSFTSCPIITNKKPLWEVKARQMKYNKEKDKLIVLNGIITLKGIPVAWVPYMQYTGEKNQRKTGLLTPKIGTVNSTTYLENNLFINASPSQNIYIKHRIHGDVNFNSLNNFIDLSDMKNLLQYDHYGYIKDGDFKIKTGILTQKNDSNETFFMGSFNHPLTDVLRTTANISYVSNNTFIREYNLTDVMATEERFANSNLTIEAITSNFHVSLNGSSSHNIKIDQETIDPSLQSIYFIDLNKYGNISGRSDIYYTETKDIANQEGLFGNMIDYKKSFITKVGVFTASSELRATGIITKDEQEDEQRYYTGTINTLTWEIPFSKFYEDGFVSITPILSIISSDFISSSDEEWESELKTKTVDSFLSNKYFYTWDSFSEQKDISYGLQGTINKQNYNGNLFAGLSQSIAGDQNTSLNDILLSLNFNIKNHFNIYYQGNYQIESSEFTESYFTIRFYNSLFSAKSSYILGTVDSSSISRNDEIFSVVIFKATENINVYASNLIGIDIGQIDYFNKTFLKELEIGILWKNSCLILGTLVEIKRYNIGNIKSDLSASIFIEFKGLGQIKSDGGDFENKIFKY